MRVAGASCPQGLRSVLCLLFWPHPVSTGLERGLSLKLGLTLTQLPRPVSPMMLTSGTQKLQG